MSELTPEQKVLRKTLMGLEDVMKKAQKDYHDVKKTCKHVVVESEKSDAAVCGVCETYLGWYCPSSPDHCCHYFTNSDGKTVDLVSGEKATIPDADEHYPAHESDDVCLFCGSPEERR